MKAFLATLKVKLAEFAARSFSGKVLMIAVGVAFVVGAVLL